jgi:hypothetical protein
MIDKGGKKTGSIERRVEEERQVQGTFYELHCEKAGSCDKCTSPVCPFADG